ncbi:MAG: phosphoglucosamine mutase [bacterium]
MNPLKISVTGVRGIVGETFTPHLVVQFSQAFATYIGSGSVAVCRDTRPSGKMVCSAVLSGLLASGLKAIDLGVCPIPTMEYFIYHTDTAGGIAVSAGHNPLNWNALKFIRSDGIYLNEREGEELLDIYHSGQFLMAPWNRIHKVHTNTNSAELHLNGISSSVDVPKIRNARLKVAVDVSGGACGAMVERMLNTFGCDAILLNAEPGKKVPYYPEPTRDNMSLLETVVSASEADVGFMLDTGGERLGIVTDEGEAMPEDFTLALCAFIALRRQPGTVVTNISTTHALEAVARRLGATVHRTPIGQSYVSEAAKKMGAIIAGEGSGGVVVPTVQYAQDSLAAIALILDFLAGERKPLSAIHRTLPRLIMKKMNIEMDFTTLFTTLERARSRAESEIRGAELNHIDGIKIEWKDAWLHIRASNTESLIRIIAEGKDEDRVNELLTLGESLLRY